MKSEECVIVGGGIAGLSAANRLAEEGISPLIIDASHYPAHRLCGEFISHECLPLLLQWDIPLPQTISQCKLIHGKITSTLDLPISARSCSRYHLDETLLQRAQRKGARLLMETRVLSVQYGSKASEEHQLTLSNGEHIRARHLIMGVGRSPNQNSLRGHHTFRYSGFKAHFEGIELNQCLEMYFFSGGYLGLSPIGNGQVNVACLMKSKVPNPLSPLEFFAHLKSIPSLAAFNEKILKGTMLFPQWMSAQVPEFGIRSNPSVERVYWIGDAAGSIPPISGDGLAIAILSGGMAADYLLKSDWKGFQEAWLERMQSRFFWAKQLHRLMLCPPLSALAIQTAAALPMVSRFFWKNTREKGS